MRLSVFRSLHYRAGWLAAFHSGLKLRASSCSLLLTLPQALSSFMRAIDAQSATVQKARYLADMEQP